MELLDLLANLSEEEYLELYNQPHLDGWVFDTQTLSWQAPFQPADNTIPHYWDEKTKNWIPIPDFVKPTENTDITEIHKK